MADPPGSAVVDAVSRPTVRGLDRRHCLLLAPALLPLRAAASVSLADAMAQARGWRDQAIAAGDQAYGAVVVRGGRVIGGAPSRVVTAHDPTAHAEMEAIRDAARFLASRDLSGSVLVSTSRPCRMCEAAAGWARIARMVYGESLTDAGAPS